MRATKKTKLMNKMIGMYGLGEVLGKAPKQTRTAPAEKTLTREQKNFNRMVDNLNLNKHIEKY